MDADEVDEALAGAAEVAARGRVFDVEVRALVEADREARAELDRQGAPSGGTVHGRIRDLARVLRQGEEPLPPDREGRTTHFTIRSDRGVLDGYVSVNLMPDGVHPREVFVRLAKPSNASSAEADHYAAVSALLDAAAMCASKALAAGVPASWFARMFRRVRFEPSGRTNLVGLDGTPFCAASPLDLVGFLLERYVRATDELYCREL